jgi:FKBP-type peptidyl-prolyl cis-trans isomerase
MSFFFACGSPVQEEEEIPAGTVKEQFVRANKYMYRRHQEHISAFVSRVGWDAEVTPSGLWIVRQKTGEGKRIDEGSRVVYSFTSRLLDGTFCYEASEEDPKGVLIGRGGVESGVEEGLRKLREGSEATLIIPPHLAHGNFGDGDRIPGNSVLIYKVRILDVQ